jgi:hypothetical protein
MTDRDQVAEATVPSFNRSGSGGTWPLNAIVQRCEQKRCDPGVIERRIGRLLGKNTRAARLFSVRVGRDEKN